MAGTQNPAEVKERSANFIQFEFGKLPISKSAFTCANYDQQMQIDRDIDELCTQTND